MSESVASLARSELGMESSAERQDLRAWHRRLVYAGPDDPARRSTPGSGLRRASCRLARPSTMLAFAVLLTGAVASPAGAQIYLDQQFGVNVTSDIVYATGAVQFPFSFDKELRLDLYEPTGPSVPALKPGFVFAHGDGFISGSKTNATMVSLADAYAQRGYVAVSIDYRLVQDGPPTPGVTPVDRAVNAAIEDAANAVRWMRANAVSYGIDPDRIAIGGYSAGAVTALGAAYGEHGADAEVQAVMSLSGAMYGQESWIDAGEAPLIMIHGTDDLTVPYALALVVQVAALLAPIELEFHALSGVGHGVPAQLDTWMVEGVTLNVKIRDFVYQALGLAPAKVPVSTPMGWLALCLLLAVAGVAAAARRTAQSASGC
ncbi:MAG: alpha/beta hydrolase [Deltaproteobacteria bacterium]|nr:alpha/beta hydrolase [Deltaproteobacteria bacterium]MBW2362333.1 alpha/beta hydrolase [Deltaproteobacteria bacterium]